LGCSAAVQCINAQNQPIDVRNTRWTAQFDCHKMSKRKEKLQVCKEQTIAADWSDLLNQQR